MVQVESINRNQINQEKIEEGKPSITDLEITEANKLFKSSKKNPLSVNDEVRLEKLRTKRKETLNNLFPEFSLKNITGLEGADAGAQYELAKKYFEKIIAMKGKSDATYNYAFKIEKLQNWEEDPENLKKTFPSVFKKRQDEYLELTQDINSIKTSNFIKTREWNKFVKNSELNNVTEREITKFRFAINKLRLTVKSLLPDYYREAVLYLPYLAKDADISLEDNFRYMNGQRRSNLRKSLNLHQGKIDQFEAAEKKYNENKKLRVISA